MELPRARSNSLRIDFGRSSPEPKDVELFSFLRTTVKVACEDLVCVYRDTTEACIFVKFKTEELLHAALNRLPTELVFVYQDGKELKVTLTSAVGTCKYIRLFNLPPEIEDREIANVLTKFGKIQRLIREKYPADTGFPIWSGVRGVYMELTTELPELVHVRNFPTRVHYAGMKHKCFVCGSLEHLKAGCPKRRKSINEVSASAEKNNPPQLSLKQAEEMNQTEEKGASLSASGSSRNDTNTIPRSSKDQWVKVQRRKKRERKEKIVNSADELSEWLTESEVDDTVQVPVKKQLRVRKSSSSINPKVVSVTKQHQKLTRSKSKKINQVAGEEDLTSIETPV